MGGGGAIFMSNPQPSCFGLLLGWLGPGADGAEQQDEEVLVVDDQVDGRILELYLL